MIHYYSAREIETMCKRPIGTIQRWASRDRWRRTEDGRKPVLYLAEDVERTLGRMAMEGSAA